ncbi:MAG: hypothetical protein ABI741_00370 [Ferruginibacter sp.]
MPRIKLSKNKSQLSILNHDEKSCLYCDKEIRDGRSDKKFCDDCCRNRYNNVLNAAGNNLVRNINNALNKNRRILKTQLSTGKTKTTQKELIKAGFDFKYHTHTQLNKKDKLYHFCYEYGYLALENNALLIVTSM